VPDALLGTYDSQRREAGLVNSEFGTINGGHVATLMLALRQSTTPRSGEPDRSLAAPRQLDRVQSRPPITTGRGTVRLRAGQRPPTEVVDNPVIDYLPHDKPGCVRRICGCEIKACAGWRQ
jgi:hypothetical protein